MPLTDEERQTLEALQAKEKEPDPPRGGGRSENVHLDLTEAVRDKILTPAEARKFLGLDSSDDGDGDDDDPDGKKKTKKKDDDDDDPDGGVPPRRKGYFKDAD